MDEFKNHLLNSPSMQIKYFSQSRLCGWKVVPGVSGQSCCCCDLLSSFNFYFLLSYSSYQMRILLTIVFGSGVVVVGGVVVGGSVGGDVTSTGGSVGAFGLFGVRGSHVTPTA